jgi:hypothetical protein
MHIFSALSLVIPILLQICIIVALLRRRLQRRFLWFFIYVCYALCELIIRLAASPDQRAYFIVYWSTAIPGVVLTLLALWESFLAIFLPETQLRWFMWVFWGCMTVAVAYAVLQATVVPPRQAGRLMTVILDLEFGSGVIIAMFGLLYAGAIRLFGILEHQRETAIIFGFTTYATMATLSVVTRSAFGTKIRMVTEYIPAVAYILAEAIWTRDLLRDEQTLPEPTQTLEQMSEALNRYIGILNRYVGRER